MSQFNIIKLALVEHGKTGRRFAAELGKSACPISKWCSNTAQPDIKTLNNIANALNFDDKYLLVSNKHK